MLGRSCQLCGMCSSLERVSLPASTEDHGGGPPGRAQRPSSLRPPAAAEGRGAAGGGEAERAAQESAEGMGSACRPFAWSTCMIRLIRLGAACCI